MSETKTQRRKRCPAAAAEADSKSPFSENEEGCVVVDGVVHLTVDGVRDMLGYQPVSFGLQGQFDPSTFPVALVQVDSSDAGILYSVESIAPTASVVVIREAGVETANLFVPTPMMTGMVVAHRVEAEVAMAQAMADRAVPDLRIGDPA